MMSERQSMDVDVVCVGFGPAVGGFLTTLSRALLKEDGSPAIESTAMPGMPLQALCFERADDIGFGVSGVVTRARGIRASFPDLDPTQIPSATPVTNERVLYLLDPIGASRRTTTLRAADRLTRALRWALPYEKDALRLPYIPPFLRKDDGLVLSIGQFNQWVGAQLMANGTVQIWPATPVDRVVVEDDRVTGVQLIDQGTDKQGNPESGYMPGMRVRAGLTVVGDGPVGAIGRQLDERFGMPDGHEKSDWAVGMKIVVQLPEHVNLEPGTVIHTFGYPEPEIFGFLYVSAERTASVGIFVPSWLRSPVRTSYRYLQHWMLHPYLWRYLEGGTLVSWGAKSIQESGKRGEPHLVGDGYARIGEGSGSTNVLTGSGVDEAWTTGTQLAEGVIELLREGAPLTKENLERAYVQRRRQSWVESEARVAEHARDGFHHGLISGLVGMALAGLTGGKLSLRSGAAGAHRPVPSLEAYYRKRIPAAEIERIAQECSARGTSLHDALMDRWGWPAVPHDGKLLISNQDALLLGGKVQAQAGYADHVVFRDPHMCRQCQDRVCIEICSGEAIRPGAEGVPSFDREKCVFCGACLWNCAPSTPDGTTPSNIDFRAGAGGLHSVQN